MSSIFLGRPQARVRGALGKLAAYPFALLAIVLLIAAALRLYGFEDPLIDSFSWREGSTAMMADNFAKHSWNIFYPEVNWTGPGAGYQGREFQIVSYMAAGLDALFGWHDWFGRIVAAAFGLGSVLAFWWVVREQNGELNALAAAFILAILPGAALIDRSFLPDPAMLTFSLAGLGCLLRYQRQEAQIWLALGAALIAFALLAKLPALAVLPPASYLLLTQGWRQGRLSRPQVIKWAVWVGAVLAPAALYYGWAIHLGRTYPPYHIAGQGYIWQEPLTFIQRAFFLRKLAMDFKEWFITLPLVLLAVVGALPRHAPATQQPRARWLFPLWLLSDVVVYGCAADEMSTNPWNLLIFAPPIAAFAAEGLLRICGMAEAKCSNVPRRAWISLVCAAPILLWGSISAIRLEAYPQAQNAFALGKRLEALSRPNDLVITAASTIGDPISIYYSRRKGWVFPPYGGAQRVDTLSEDQMAIAQVERLRKAGGKWFGIAKDARDVESRALIDFNRGLLLHLDQTAEKVVETDKLLIYRLDHPSRTPAPQTRLGFQLGSHCAVSESSKVC